jgi:hypothetical protein
LKLQDITRISGVLVPYKSDPVAVKQKLDEELSKIEIKVPFQVSVAGNKVLCSAVQ